MDDHEASREPNSDQDGSLAEEGMELWSPLIWGGLLIATGIVLVLSFQDRHWDSYLGCSFIVSAAYEFMAYDFGWRLHFREPVQDPDQRRIERPLTSRRVAQMMSWTVIGLWFVLVGLAHSAPSSC